MERMAAIVQEGTSYRLELKDDFRTSNSGGLDVRLCNQPQCTGAFLDLGPIASVRGAQRYNLADAGTAYDQVVIWCRGARLAFGFGNLR